MVYPTHHIMPRKRRSWSTHTSTKTQTTRDTCHFGDGSFFTFFSSTLVCPFVLRIFISIILAIVPLDLSTSKQYYLVFWLRSTPPLLAYTYFEFQSVKQKLIYNDTYCIVNYSRYTLGYNFYKKLVVCLICNRYVASDELQNEPNSTM